MIEIIIALGVVGVWMIFFLMHDMATRTELRFKDEEMEKLWLETPKKSSKTKPVRRSRKSGSK